MNGDSPNEREEIQTIHTIHNPDNTHMHSPIPSVWLGRLATTPPFPAKQHLYSVPGNIRHVFRLTKCMKLPRSTVTSFTWHEQKQHYLFWQFFPFFKRLASPWILRTFTKRLRWSTMWTQSLPAYRATAESSCETGPHVSDLFLINFVSTSKLGNRVLHEAWLALSRRSGNRCL